MPQQYTMSQSARMLGITRRALSGWIQDTGITTGTLPGDGRTQTLTRDQIRRLGAAHGKRVADESLEAQITALQARVEALEAWQEEVEAWAEAQRRAPQRAPGPCSAPDAPVDLADTVKLPRVKPS